LKIEFCTFELYTKANSSKEQKNPGKESETRENNYASFPHIENAGISLGYRSYVQFADTIKSMIFSCFLIFAQNFVFLPHAEG
jgi:Zn-dependent oligopeptidase